MIYAPIREAIEQARRGFVRKWSCAAKRSVRALRTIEVMVEQELEESLGCGELGTGRLPSRCHELGLKGQTAPDTNCAASAYRVISGGPNGSTRRS